MRLDDQGQNAIPIRPPAAPVNWEKADHTRCAACGASLEREEKLNLLWWPDRSEHVGCHDWSNQPYPLRYLLPILRALYRVLPGLRLELERAGRELDAIEKRWPGDAPAALVLAGRRRRNQLREFIKKARIGQRLGAIDD